MLAGALHALAAVRNCDHALLCAVLHAPAASFIELLKVAHAALIAARTCDVVVPVYACCNALARAAYAACTACPCVAIAASIVVSRAFTAAPRQAILVAVLEVVPAAAPPVVLAVCAKAGAIMSPTRPSEIAPVIISFLDIFSFEVNWMINEARSAGRRGANAKI